jgi:rod shape-determining protein MreC
MPLPIRGASRGRVVFVLLLLSVTLITISVRGNSTLEGARSTSRDWFSPVRDAFGKVFHPFENVWHGVRDYDKLRQDYLALKDQVSRNEGVSIEAETQVKELNELRAQFGLLPCSAIPKKLAEVVGRPATNYESSVEINKGTDDGLVTGMPAVTPAGLVGRVGQSSSTHAFVQLLYDPTVHFSVNILGTANTSKTPQEILDASASAGGGIASTSTTVAGDASTTTTTPDAGDGTPGPTTTVTPTTTVPPTTTTTILVATELGDLHGNGRGKPITVDFLRGVQNVRVGDPVVTAGNDSSLAPPCIPIGRVKSVSAKKGSSQLEVVVEPVADLDRLGLVTVVLYNPARRPPPPSPATPTTSPAPPATSSPPST